MINISIKQNFYFSNSNKLDLTKTRFKRLVIRYKTEYKINCNKYLSCYNLYLNKAKQTILLFLREK